MITFVATDKHQYTFRGVLETRNHSLHGRLVILSYEEFLSFHRLPRSAYVFVDLERLSAAEMKRVMKRIEALRQVCPDCEMLNLPDRVGSRLDVMRRLHEAGINDFRMLPITTPPEAFRYPVFLRRLDDHEGPISGLLGTPQALRDAVAQLEPMVRQSDQLVVTEYVDARNSVGLYEKRSYSRVGDWLIPTALEQSQDWVCKGEYNDPNNVLASEQAVLAFLESQTDKEVLRAAFDAADIQYGRADYALIDGRPQVFEINTNPWVEPPEQAPDEARKTAERVLRVWLDALAELADRAPVTSITWVEVPHATGRPTRSFSRRNVAHAVLYRLHQLHNETRAMRWLRRVKLL